MTSSFLDWNSFLDILNDESARKAAFHQHFKGKFRPESLRYWDWTIFYSGTSAPCLLATTTTVTTIFFFFLVFIYLSIHSTTPWSGIKKRKKELGHEFNLAILTSHLVNNAYLLSCCIISGFVYFYSSRLEKW